MREGAVHSQAFCLLVSTRVLISCSPSFLFEQPPLHRISGPGFLCLRNAEFIFTPQLLRARQISGVQATLRGGFSGVDDDRLGSGLKRVCKASMMISSSRDKFGESVTTTSTRLGEMPGTSFVEPDFGGGPANHTSPELPLSKKSIKKLKRLQSYLEWLQLKRQLKKEGNIPRPRHGLEIYFGFTEVWHYF